MNINSNVYVLIFLIVLISNVRQIVWIILNEILKSR